MSSFKNGDIVRLPDKGLAFYNYCEPGYGDRLYSLDKGVTIMHKDGDLEKVPQKEWESRIKDYLPAYSIYKFGARVNYGISGTDPEIFAFGPKGQLIPAFNFLPPEKEAQQLAPTVGLERAKARAYWDGFQAELRTESMRKCHGYLTDDIRVGLHGIYTKLKAAYPDAHLECRDVVKVPRKLLESVEHEHVAFGCTPSYNVYGIEAIDIDEPRAMQYRFSGCHIHQSMATSMFPEPAKEWWPNGTVVMMDKLFGLVMTALGRDLEDPTRRKYYGRPGEYRLPKSPDHTRLEYRTPGSFLLRAPQLFHLALDTARAAFRMGLLMDGRAYEALPTEAVRDIILACDADAAVKLMQSNEKMFLDMWTPLFGSTGAQVTLDAVYKGALSLGWERTVEAAWKLDGEWAVHSDDSRRTWGTLIGAPTGL